MSKSNSFVNHDPALISILEVVGSYFVDIYFNHIYSSSKLHKSSRSITDEYKKQIQTYILAVKNDSNLYRSMVVNLHRYFQSCTSYTTITFNNFVDKVTEYFIPDEYLDLYRTDERDEVLSSILCDLVSGLGTYCTTSEMLSRIIDHHDNWKVTVRMMQDHSIAMMLTKRDDIHSKLLGESSQAREAVSISVVNGLTEKIHTLVQEKAKLVSKVKKLEGELDDCDEREQMLEDNVRKLIRRLKGEGGGNGNGSGGSSSRRKEKKKKHKKLQQQQRDKPRKENVQLPNIFERQPATVATPIDKEKFRKQREELLRRKREEEGESDFSEEEEDDEEEDEEDE